MLRRDTQRIMHILLVEDDVFLRQALANCLRAGGIQDISEADDGQAALEFLERTSVDLVLTDCQMPRLDGINLVRRLRQRGCQVPFIMISSQGHPDIVVTAIRAGVNNYLPKPIRIDLLMEKIWQTMGMQPLRASA